MPYIGNQPGTGVRNRFIYTATASQTTFSGADDNGKTLKYADSDFVDVFLNGVCLVPVTDYTSTSKTSIVLTQAASLSDTLEVIAYDIATISDTVSKADGGTFEANVTFAAGADIITGSAGTDNVRIGSGALGAIQSGGNENVAVGKDALAAQTTADNNTAVGTEALAANTTASSNTAFGWNALKLNVTGNNNVAVGASALDAITAGDKNVAIGVSALGTQNTSSGADTHNVAVGHASGARITSGTVNTLLGSLSGTDIVDGSNNVALGYNAGASITSGDQNTFVGSLNGDAITSGEYNTALGYKALSLDTQGNRAVAVGYEALANQNFTSSSDNQNTAVGFHAGKEITTGTENVAIGGEALDACTVGNGNVAVGVQALSTDVNGSRNTAVGTTALKVAEASGSTSSNQYNVGLGYGAGLNVSTGGYNTYLGSFAGDTSTNGGSNICIGYSADTFGGGTDNAIVLGVNITAGSNDFSFGKASNVVTNDFDTDANWSRSSDVRLKKNITDQKLGLDFINDLRTVKYNWKASHELDSTDSQLSHLYKEDEADNEMNTEATMHNFIAQEVKAALDTAGVSDFSGWSEDEHGVQQVSREMFVIPLVKAVQELSAKVTALETENTTQATQIADLITRVTALEAG